MDKPGKLKKANISQFCFLF